MTKLEKQTQTSRIESNKYHASKKQKIMCWILAAIMFTLVVGAATGNVTRAGIMKNKASSYHSVSSNAVQLSTSDWMNSLMK